MKDLSSMGPYIYLLIFVLLVAGVSTVLSIHFNKKAKENWLKDHPNALEVRFQSKNNLLTQKDIVGRVLKGCGVFVFDQGKCLLLAEPGEIQLELTYRYTRPGVMYKTVTHQWGPEKKDFVLKASHHYELVFDGAIEDFKLMDQEEKA